MDRFSWFQIKWQQVCLYSKHSLPSGITAGGKVYRLYLCSTSLYLFSFLSYVESCWVFSDGGASSYRKGAEQGILEMQTWHRQTCVFFTGVPLALLSSIFVYPVCSHPELVLLTPWVGARKQLEYVRMSCPDKKCQNHRACFLKQLEKSSDVSLRKLLLVSSLSKLAFSFPRNST